MEEKNCKVQVIDNNSMFEYQNKSKSEAIRFYEEKIHEGKKMKTKRRLKVWCKNEKGEDKLKRIYQ